MKKIETENILILILIFIAISSIIIPNSIGNFDEIWNYNFARNIADGLIPYKDFNMLQMPLLPYIAAMFLKITCNELIVMRILAALLCTGIIYMVYKIFTLLNIEKRVSFLFSFGIAFLSRDIFCIDYNWATLFILLIIIYIELKELNRNKFNVLCNDFKVDFLLGIMAGICLGFKQTTGIIISVILLGYKLLLVKDKEDLKIYLKISLNRIIGILIPIILLILYLIFSNSFAEFIDYTILGIKHFDNNISYLNLFNLSLSIKILAALVPITLIYSYVKTVLLKIKNDSDKNLFIIFAYSIATIILVYPIADKIHFVIGSIPTIIAMLYIIYVHCKKINLSKFGINLKEFLLYMATLWIILFLIFYSISNLYKYLIANNKASLKHFKNLSISKQFEEDIIKIDNYILEQEKEGRKTYILDAYAAIYMIPIDKYNKDYDMFLKGNLGNNETEKIIHNLESEENLNILIRKKGYSLNWQTPFEIIEYFRKNLKSEESINVFDIYKGEKNV